MTTTVRVITNHLTEVIETGSGSEQPVKHILQAGEERDFYVYDNKQVIVREIEDATLQVDPRLGTGDDPVDK